jgi:RNA polymerase sigma-70 factor (ECF subfamily)
MRRRASKAAIEAIYRESFTAFLSTATAALMDAEAARDVVQEAFALALRGRATFRGEGALEAWIWKILVNVLRDRLRAAAKEPHALPFDGAETSLWSSEGDVSELRAHVSALPYQQRMALFLRYYADLSYEQIAQALEVAPGTVGAALHAAHERLRRELEEVNQ